MKKIFLAIFLVFILQSFARAEVLRGGATYDEIPKGFFGVWHVTSKMESSNNPSLFNKLSVDIWNLSGYGNVLILENSMTGAKSSIQVTPQKNYDGKSLKFTRVKEEIQGKTKTVHILLKNMKIAN